MLRRMIGKEWIIGPGIGELTDHPGLARRLRDSGRRIHVWTVNTDAQLALCASLGVETILSDRRAYMLERVRRQPALHGHERSQTEPQLERAPRGERGWEYGSS